MPGIVFIVAMSITGYTGAAAVTSALAFLGGPAGLYGGIAILPIIAIASDYLAKYGLEFLVAKIYQERINTQGVTVSEVVREITDLKFISDSSKKTIIDKVYQSFGFVLVGRTGVGKSSTVNSLMGAQVAKVGDTEPTTFTVTPYKIEKAGVMFTIWDTPGLCDAADNRNDNSYIDQIKEIVDSVDCLWFVTRLDETRLSSDERYALLLITNALGSKIWDNALIVFTHACNLSVRDRHELALQERTEIIKEYLREITDSTLDTLSSIAVDNLHPALPNGEPWLPELFTRVIENASNKGSVAFAASVGQDTNNSSANSGPRINLNEDQKRRVSLRIGGLLTAVTAGTMTGAIFGPGGAVVGGIVGAALAFWKGVRR